MVCDQPMVWNMVHFDVQLLGSVVLHGGSLKWRRRGQDTVATLPHLNALTGRGAFGHGQRLSRQT
jgi:preprotein translocase subunit SecA